MRVANTREREDIERRVQGLRGLPLKLSGVGLRLMGRTSTRVNALFLCRDNIGRFFDGFVDKHAEVEAVAAIVRKQWADEKLPTTTIKPTDTYDPGAETTEPLAPHLRGHTLGAIPDSHVEADEICGDPDTADTSRPAAKEAAHERALAADLVRHSRTLREMRDSEHQHNKLLAAHVLSSSCATSGAVVRSIPTKAGRIQCSRMSQILRLRMGVPCAMPVTEWRCNCSAQAGPTQRTWAERTNEPNEADAVERASFASQPLHGLYCRRRWRRVMHRHDGIRNALCTALNRITGVRATLEPRVQGGADERRADINVHKDGNSWLVDVGVVRPSTRRFLALGADKTPGTAAKAYEDVKLKKYEDVANFIPFIVETGGRINDLGCNFVQNLFNLQDAPGDREHHGRLFRDVSRSLALQQGFMLARITDEIRAPDLAVERAGTPSDEDGGCNAADDDADANGDGDNDDDMDGIGDDDDDDEDDEDEDDDDEDDEAGDGLLGLLSGRLVAED
jgi:hypothetical protein